MEKGNQEKNKRLPEWASWTDVKALADITRLNEQTVYKILVGDRSDRKIKEVIDTYKAAVKHIASAQKRIIHSIKEEFQHAS